MEQKEIRSVFGLLLLAGAFCAMLWTVTTIAPLGGIGMVFRIVICGGLTIAFLALFVADLMGIWTGHWPHPHLPHRKH